MGSTAFPARLSVPPVARSAARELRQRRRPHQYRGGDPPEVIGKPYFVQCQSSLGPASAGPLRFVNLKRHLDLSACPFGLVTILVPCCL